MLLYEFLFTAFRFLSLSLKQDGCVDVSERYMMYLQRHRCIQICKVTWEVKALYFIRRH